MSFILVDYDNVKLEMPKNVIFRRMTHFSEHLKLFNGNTEIPEHLLNTIKVNNTLQSFTNQDIRDILKKTNNQKYNVYAPCIGIKSINSINSMQLTPDIKAGLIEMFEEIIAPYTQWGKMVNFINYSYLLHRFFELLEMHEFSTLCKLPKNKTIHDDAWAYICKTLGKTNPFWRYIPK